MKSIQMKKLAVSTVVAAAMFAAMSPAQALVGLNASTTFNVTITLTSGCTIAMTTPPGDIALAYTDGGATATGTTSVDVTCTNTLPYTLSMNGLVGAGNYGPINDASTGLNYTVAFNAGGTAGADVNGAGTGVAQTVTIGANITAGQFGTCALGSCVGTPQAQTVYVNY